MTLVKIDPSGCDAYPSDLTSWRFSSLSQLNQLPSRPMRKARNSTYSDF